MPSKKKHLPANAKHLPLFVTLVAIAFILWMVYRFRLTFPVWFDETVGKAVFFGAPVWVFVNTTHSQALLESWSSAKLKPGLLQGIAFGGIFGFAASLVAVLMTGSTVISAPLFAADAFWWEFLLALLTGFWETLFFFTFILGTLFALYPRDPGKAVALSTLIFLVFHVPNTFLRYQMQDVPLQLLLLTLFALGQALIFWYRRNAYTLTLTHALWGMAVLVHVP